jgi:hypothetical protein
MWRFFSKHPLSIVFYLIYLFFIARLGWVKLQFENITGPKLTIGEGVMYGMLFTGIIAMIFSIITAINMMAFKTDKKFYRWLLLLIVLPAIVLFIL